MENNKCCRIKGCNSISCVPHPNCDEECTQQKIIIEDEKYIIKVPMFVFESSIEFAQNQAIRVFTDLWHHHNWEEE